MDGRGYKVISIAIKPETEKPIFQYNVDFLQTDRTIREKWLFGEQDGYDVPLNID